MDAFTSVEKARNYMFASNEGSQLMFLTVDGYAYCFLHQLPPGARCISVGYYGYQGWVEHIQDFGRTPSTPMLAGATVKPS
jgi:hypothetical protein